MAPGGEVLVRLRLLNAGGRQAGRLRGGVWLPDGLRFVGGTAAELRVAPSEGTGFPVDGAKLMRGELPIRAVPAGDRVAYRLTARVRPDARGALQVRGRVEGEGGPAQDDATVRVR